MREYNFAGHYFCFHKLYVFIWIDPYARCYEGGLNLNKVTIYSKRDSPVRCQIYLLKIASIYGNFTPIGGGGGGGVNGYFWVFLEN